jgi:hypothetical protein
MVSSVTRIFELKKDQVSYFGKIIIGFYCLELTIYNVHFFFDFFDPFKYSHYLQVAKSPRTIS